MRNHLSSLRAWCLIAFAGMSMNTALAIDCWVPTRDQATTGYGDRMTSPRHANVVSRMRQAEVILRADPVLMSLPGVRLQIKNFVGLPVQPSLQTYATVTLGMHRPGVWASGCSLNQAKADYVVPIEFGANFNDVTPIARLLASPAAVTESGFFPTPEVTGFAGGLPIYAQRMLAITPQGVPLLIAHRVKDHLNHWETQFKSMLKDAPGEPLLTQQLHSLQAHRAGLSATQLQEPVALGAQHSDPSALWAYGTVGSLGTQPMARLNPALLKPSQREGGVRFIVLQAWINNEEDPLVGAAQNWLKSLDPRPWAALLEP